MSHEQYRYPAIQLADDHTFMDQMFKVAEECQEFIAEMKKYKDCVDAGAMAAAREALRLAKFEMCNVEHAVETARRIDSVAVVIAAQQTVEENAERGYYGDVMDLLPTRGESPLASVEKFEFNPTHTLAIFTGHPPKSIGDDLAFYERLTDHDCIKNKLLKWFARGKVGASSKTMARIAAGMPHHPFSCYPLDPSDFNRCLLLVDKVPEVRNYFEQIASLSPQWNALIQNWDELAKTFNHEAGLDWCKATSAPSTYALINAVLAEA